MSPPTTRVYTLDDLIADGSPHFTSTKSMVTRAATLYQSMKETAEQQVAGAAATTKVPIAEVYGSWKSHNWSAEAVSKLLVQSQDTIRLTSRNDGYTITVYKELLCFYCPYYRAALKGEFLEAKKNELEIDAVEIFIGWLCTGTINTDIHQCEDIVLVYLLADRIECLALRRAAISKLQALHRGNSGEPFLLPWAIIGLVYEKSALDSSPVRRYIRDFYSEHYRENLSCAKEKDCYNEAGLEFFFEVMVRQSAILLSGRSMKKKCECCNNACKYHEHKSEEERQQTCGLLR